MSRDGAISGWLFKRGGVKSKAWKKRYAVYEPKGTPMLLPTYSRHSRICGRCSRALRALAAVATSPYFLHLCRITAFFYAPCTYVIALCVRPSLAHKVAWSLGCPLALYVLSSIVLVLA